MKLKTQKVSFKNFLRRRTAFTTRTPLTTRTPVTSFPLNNITASSNKFSRPTAASRRKYPTRTTTAKLLESQEPTTFTTPKPKVNLSVNVSRRHFLRRTTKPTAVTTNPNLISFSTPKVPYEHDSVGKPIELRNVIVAILHNASENSSALKPAVDHDLIDFTEHEDLVTTEVFNTQSKQKTSSAIPTTTLNNNFPFTTPKPKVEYTIRVKHGPLHTIANTSPFQKHSTDLSDRVHPTSTQNRYRIDYNTLQSYNIDSSLTDPLPEQTKVLLHSNGIIECLDQGNFPHPISCKKFVSCAKMENGKIIGWEYTCPKNLSFDPIGGICNWSAEVLCDDRL